MLTENDRKLNTTYRTELKVTVLIKGEYYSNCCISCCPTADNLFT